VPRARLCVVRSWHDGRGYGFTVLAGRDRPDLVVGGVDLGSPAAAAGIRPGDRLVEVFCFYLFLILPLDKRVFSCLLRPPPGRGARNYCDDCVC